MGCKASTYNRDDVVHTLLIITRSDGGQLDSAIGWLGAKKHHFIAELIARLTPLVGPPGHRCGWLVTLCRMSGLGLRRDLWSLRGDRV
jgi:hypothetical protein